MITDVIIPAYNEESSIAHVLREIPRELIREIVVVNNASTDSTRVTAEKEGAIVIDEPVRGYGAACLAGILHVKQNKAVPDIIIFLDADHSDFPENIRPMLGKLTENNADLIIGNRVKELREKGSMTFPQRFGNALATRMIKWFHGYRYKDLGPFRAIRFQKLLELDMRDTNYGWTVEMQIKALKKGLKVEQINVPYRNRIGKSKISGTLGGSIKAGYKIIRTILKYR
ncbi:MAG: glycosyltransferase family 2 protein [Flavobacteriales bacterium]